jgi:nucleoid-associated protein YgaU
MAPPPAGQPDGGSPTAAAPEETEPAPAQVGTEAPAGAGTAQAPVQQPATPDAPAAPSSTQVADAPQETAATQTETAQQSPSETAPAPETPARVAAAPEADAPASSASPAGETGDRVTETPATPRVTVEAVETEDSKVFVAGAGEPNSDVRVYFDNTLIGEARTDSKGRWLMETENEVAPGEVDVRADQIVPDTGTVVARAQVTFEKAEDAIVLRPVSATGAAGDGEGASASTGERQIPSIIIRTGDNLWTISQRRYGEGLRYTTIYQANKDQIRNPDLIYPGQVFMMPEGDRNWPVAN